MVTSAKEKNKMEEERKLGGHFGTGQGGPPEPWRRGVQLLQEEC